MKVITENGCKINTLFTEVNFTYNKKTDELFIEWKDFVLDENEAHKCLIKDKVIKLEDK